MKNILIIKMELEDRLNELIKEIIEILESMDFRKERDYIEEALRNLKKARNMLEDGE